MSQKNGRLNHTAAEDKIVSYLCILLYWKEHRQILCHGLGLSGQLFSIECRFYMNMTFPFENLG